MANRRPPTATVRIAGEDHKRSNTIQFSILNSQFSIADYDSLHVLPRFSPPAPRTRGTAAWYPHGRYLGKLFHRPTGISVRVHEQREQHRNRELAYQLLIQHIIDKHSSEEQQKRHAAFVMKISRRRRMPSIQKTVLLNKRLHGALKRSRKPPTKDHEAIL
jgi:hypothetical protein